MLPVMTTMGVGRSIPDQSVWRYRPPGMDELFDGGAPIEMKTRGVALDADGNAWEYDPNAPGGMIEIGGGSGDEMPIATVNLTSAQLLGLYTTPVQIIPAPGVGKAIVPVSVFASYAFGTVKYSNVGSTRLRYSGSNWSLDDVTSALGIFGTTSSQIAISPAFKSYIYDSLSNFENRAIEFAETFSAWTGGNGTGVISIQYFISPTK